MFLKKKFAFMGSLSTKNTSSHVYNVTNDGERQETKKKWKIQWCDDCILNVNSGWQWLVVLIHFTLWWTTKKKNEEKENKYWVETTNWW